MIVPFWINQDNIIDPQDAINALRDATEEVGKKFVDQQVYNALRSNAYHSILNKVAEMGPLATTFQRSEVAENLPEEEKRQLNNFLQKMLKLNVIHKGDVAGEYCFNLPLVRAYIWLQSADLKSHLENKSSKA